MTELQKLKEAFKKFRYGLAYLIAPDWIDDFTYTISVYRTNHIDAMIRAAEEYRQSKCEQCEYYIECTERDNENVGAKEL